MNRQMNQPLYSIIAFAVLCSLQYPTNYVPDEKTAIKIAEAVWQPIYGDSIYKYRPFHARLVDNDVWHVYGTITTNKGGTPYIELQRRDAKVLKVIRTK